MKVAHIVPPQWYGLLRPGKYQMVLAHWVLDARYAEYADKVKHSGAYTLLDNGAFEGELVSSAQLLEAAARVGADEIVLPDVRGDAAETLRISWQALNRIPKQTRVIFVPQGHDRATWERSLNAWLKQFSPNRELTVGVTCLKNAQGYAVPGTREELMRSIAGRGYVVHLLGAPRPKDLVTELPEARCLSVRGMDTSTAFALGAREILLTPNKAKQRLGDPRQYETLSTRARRLIHLNAAILDNWALTGNVSKKIPTYVVRGTAKRWLKYHAEGFCTIQAAAEACGIRGPISIGFRNFQEDYLREGLPEEDAEVGLEVT